jgi:hypothetical protein
MLYSSFFLFPFLISYLVLHLLYFIGSTNTKYATIIKKIANEKVIHTLYSMNPTVIPLIVMPTAGNMGLKKQE